MKTPRYISGATLNLTCNDTQLENALCQVLSSDNGFVSAASVFSALLRHLDNENMFEKEPDTAYSELKISVKDQYRINRIMNNLISQGRVILNILGRRHFSGDGVELIWNPE